jgi:hypothetical protein
MAMFENRGEAAETAAKKDLDVLNRFLRGEISAVASYRQALEKIDDPVMRAELDDCLRSHESRAELLRDRVLALGGEPSEGAGVWGAFAKLVEGGARVFGVNAAIAALEQGEDHGRDLYYDDVADLGAANRAFVERELIPAQLQTHAALSTLKRTIH